MGHSIRRLWAIAPLVWMAGAAPAAHAQTPFTDATAEAGLDFLQPSGFNLIGGNVAMIDSDADGDLDLVFTFQLPDPIRLYENRSTVGAPLFEDISLEADVAPLDAETIGLGVGDFDGDGFDDLFLANRGPDTLLLNRGDGTFEDVSHSRLDGDSAPSVCAAVADFDIDGDLDIYVGRYVALSRFPFHSSDPDALLVNDGSGHFEDRAADFAIDQRGSTLSAVWTDADEDGDLDILIANDFGSFERGSAAFRNDGPDATGEWHLTDVSATWGFDRGVYGMGIGVLDADSDGHLDYFQTSIGRHLLLVGPADDGYTDLTDASGADSTFTSRAFRSSWGMVAFDVTGDGRDDLFVRSGHIPAARTISNDDFQTDLLWSFDEDGRAQDVSLDLLPPTEGVGRGVVAGDVDGDGRLDIVGGSARAEPRLLMGGGVSDLVRLQLDASVSAPGAVGTRVRIQCDDLLVVKELSMAGSLGSSGPPGEMWIGLSDKCAAVTPIRVTWPSGVVQMAAVARGESLVLEEPEWLTLTPGALELDSGDSALFRVEPRDGEGASLGPGHTVEVTVAGGDPEEMTDLGDGWYELEIDAQPVPGEAVLSIGVDGELLRPHPRLRTVAASPADIVIYPTHIVQGRESCFTVSLAEEAAIGLLIDGEPFSVAADSPGRGELCLDAPRDATSVTLQATADGAPIGAAIDRPIEPGADDARSVLEVFTPFLGSDGEPFLELVALIRDRNGTVYNDPTSPPILLEDEAPSERMVSQGPDGTYSVRVPDEEVVVGTRFSLQAAGVDIGAPAEIVEWSDPSELVALIDPAESRIGAYLEGCYADGQDLLTVTVSPRTAEGFQFGPLESLALEVVGATLVDGPLTARGRSDFILRCGTEAGTGTIDVRLDGEPLGIGMDFVLYPPVDRELNPEDTGVELDTRRAEMEGVVGIKVQPRTVEGVLAGSGVDVTLESEPDLGVHTLPYVGVGAYGADLPISPGLRVVEVLVFVDGEPTGEVTTIDVDLLLPGDAEGDAGGDVAADATEAPAEDSADAPPDADMGGVGDVVEPVDTGTDVPDDDHGADGGGEDVPGPDSAGTEAEPSDLGAEERAGGAEAEGGDGDSGCGCGVGGRQGGVWWLPLFLASVGVGRRVSPRLKPTHVNQATD